MRAHLAHHLKQLCCKERPRAVRHLRTYVSQDLQIHKVAVTNFNNSKLPAFPTKLETDELGHAAKLRMCCLL
jgi:hypothetical protein